MEGSKIPNNRAIMVTTVISSTMVNGYYDFINTTPLTPFIGAGLGMVSGSISDNGVSTDGMVFGYQAMVGCEYSYDKNIAFDLYYQLQNAASDFEKDGVGISYMSSNILFGVTYKF